MAHPETASRQVRPSTSRSLQETSSAHHPTLVRHPESTVRDAAQPTPPSSSPSSSSAGRPTLPPHDARQWYPYSSHPLPYPIPGAHFPFVPPPGSVLVTAMPESLFESLGTLPSQFTAFQESLGDVKSDVKNLLFQLDNLRAAQSETDSRVAVLEGVIGVGSAGTASRGRGRRTKWRKSDTRTKPDGADAGANVPEKTLIQNLASIQSAVEELLAREGCVSQPHLSVIHQEATSPSLFPPSVNLAGQDSSSHRLVRGPSQQYVTVQSTHPAPPTSQSGSTPSPVIAILTQEAEKPLPAAASGKEYADASVQAYSPTPTSESHPLPYSPKDLPGFIPVDWNFNTATLGLSNADSELYTAEYIARFLHNTRPHGATETGTDSRAPQSDGSDLHGCSAASCTRLLTHAVSTPSLSYPIELVADNTVSQHVQSIILPGASSTVPPAAATERPSPPAKVLQGLGPPGNSQMLLIFSSSPPTSADDAPTSIPSASRSQEHAGRPVRPDAESNPGIARIASDASGGQVSIAGGTKVTSESMFTVPEDPQRSTPMEADDGGLTSGLPTPPLEMFANDHESRADGCSMRERGLATDSALISRAHLQHLPIIPTPPLLSPPSRSTPHSPSPVTGSSRSGQGGRDTSGTVVTPKVTEEHTNFADGTERTAAGGGDATKEFSADVLINGGRSHLPAEQVGDEASISATDSGVPVITVTHAQRSVDASTNSSHQVPQGLSAGRPNLELPDANATGSSNFQEDGYDLGVSPAWHPTSVVPSRYSTPSGSLGSRHTQEEDEVSSALIPSVSGMSTPVPNSSFFPLISSHHPLFVHSRSLPPSAPASTCADDSSGDAPMLGPELLTVNPSMLHDPTDLAYEPGMPQSLYGPLSPLTSVGELDVGGPDSALDSGTDNTDATATQRRKKPRISPPISPAKRSHGINSKGRRSEPCHAYPPCAETSGSVARAVSEATHRCAAGGPNASLDELAAIAKRVPLKIQLKFPKTMRGLKRKWDSGAGEGEDAVQDNPGADSHGEHVRSRVAGTSMRHTLEGEGEGEGEAISTSVSTNALGTLRPTRTVMSASPLSSRLASAGSASSAFARSEAASRMSVSSKETTRRSERDRKESHRVRTAIEHDRSRQKETKRPKLKRKPFVKYHVRNGQIVAVEPRPAAQVKTGQKNPTMKTPLSSPGHGVHPGPSDRHPVRQSCTKEDTNFHLGAMWPSLPSVFSQWDAQFIQCDNCDEWFHYGCVGVMPADPRLAPEASFVCMVCHNQSTGGQTLRSPNGTCRRPDCPDPRVTDESELYFVEKLVGRKRTETYGYMWLAKWEGFPMAQGTWIPKENVVGDGTRLFDAFHKHAEEEGVDLSQDVLLLKEALDAGWHAS